MIIDLAAIRDGTGPARLPDMVEGRSEQAFTTWLGAGSQAWRDGVEVVAMAPRKRRYPRGSPATNPPPPSSCPPRSR